MALVASGGGLDSAIEVPKPHSKVQVLTVPQSCERSKECLPDVELDVAVTECMVVQCCVLEEMKL